jgi:inorganic triphosphatase YgiF
VQDGLHQREEWEHSLNFAEWDLGKLNQTPLAKIIATPAIWSKIRPVFTTDFQRKTLQLCLEQDTQIELAYDRGWVIAGEARQVIHEIELELKSGNVAYLSVLANELQRQLPVSPNNTSKAKMGYQLIKH